MPETTITCPACGAPDLVSVETITGYAPARVTCTPTGALRAAWGHAPTRIDWDSSRTIGWACGACGATWPTLQHITPRPAARAA